METAAGRVAREEGAVKGAVRVKAGAVEGRVGGRKVVVVAGAGEAE